MLQTHISDIRQWNSKNVCYEHCLTDLYFYLDFIIHYCHRFVNNFICFCAYFIQIAVIWNLYTTFFKNSVTKVQIFNYIYLGLFQSKNKSRYFFKRLWYISFILDLLYRIYGVNNAHLLFWYMYILELLPIKHFTYFIHHFCFVV